ncbi:MAG: DUF2062 domain-containing protein [Deltaproteobacteria bacterium]|nr:DUF2062 domain-containing protein [Deltaproteobacteria bacterium]
MAAGTERRGPIDRARAWISSLAHEHASPARLFAACVVGAIVGSTPFFGFHLPLCIGVAMLLRLNRVAVYGAANVSIPPVAPFLAFACIEVGSFVLHGRGTTLAVESLRHVSPWRLAGDVFLSWIVGAPLVGGAVGVVLGVVVAQAARARDARKAVAADPFEQAVRETVARFAFAKPGHRHYVRFKIRLDPVYRAICAELPDRVELVELGCGLGILPLLCVALGTRRSAVGVDWDEAKVADARRAAEGLPITIERADMRTWEPPPCDALAIIDVLHYFDDDTQAAILSRAASAVRPGGTLFVREGEAGGRGSAWTRAVERLAVAVGWNRSDARPRFRPIAAIVASLEGLGFACEVVPMAGRLHPGNVLVRARRATARATG